jgi:ATP-dependent Clp protease ATP-binding subunit ClpX
MFRRKLVCSFCGKNEKQVAKLVAGPRVFICDECVAIASALMRDDAPPPEVGEHAEGRIAENHSNGKSTE